MIKQDSCDTQQICYHFSRTIKARSQDLSQDTHFFDIMMKPSNAAEMPAKYPPITQHIAYLLAQANREINRQLKLRLSKENVTIDEWRILKVLEDGVGRSMSELAEATLLNQAALTKIVDRMVPKRLVRRVQDRTDRRKVLVFITDRGRPLCKRLNSLAADQEAHILESCGGNSTNELKQLLLRLIPHAKRYAARLSTSNLGKSPTAFTDIAR